MNPSLKLFLVLIISIEISFTHRLIANCLLIVVALILLIVDHISWENLLKLFLVPLIPAVALAITIIFFSPSHSLRFAIILVTRLYAYCFLGALVTVSTSALSLARSLEQNAHLPSKFAYGTLAALNLIPKTIQAVKIIRAAGQMRGIHLSVWSPQLYFKAVLNATSWADQLAQAMESQGFVEGQSRTAAQIIPVRITDWTIFTLSIICLQVVLLVFP